MTEQSVRSLAQRFSLQVLKRITTGNESRHFATFELTGTAQQVTEAFKAILPDARKGFDRVLYCDNPEHPDHGKPYVSLESVWCEI